MFCICPVATFDEAEATISSTQGFLSSVATIECSVREFPEGGSQKNKRMGWSFRSLVIVVQMLHCYRRPGKRQIEKRK
jgi:hypothetical protein